MNEPSITRSQLQTSRRIASMQYSPIRKLYPLMTEAQERGTTVLQLNIGQPDIATPSDFLSQDLSSIKIVAYGPSDGLPSYKKALSDYYKRHNIPIEPEELIITTAGSEAILFSLFSVCDAGDEIIIPEPYYTNYNGFCALAGVEIIPVPTAIQTGFSLPAINTITSQVTLRTKAILICNPNNPTGAVYSKETLRELLQYCTTHNLKLIVDEVYRDFVYDQEPFSILQHPNAGPQVIMIDSLSKRYSACGARLGSIASKNSEVLKQIQKCAQSRLCPPTLEQLLAVKMVEDSDEIVLSMKEQYRERVKIIESALRNSPIPITYSCPQGAFYIIAALPVEDAEDFASFMLKEYSYQGTTVFVAPAEGFYKTAGQGKNEIRIAAVLKPDKLTLAMKLLILGLEAYIRREQEQAQTVHAKKLVQFGAGNIGRSFIAQIFSSNGFEVVFVDIDHHLIDAINTKGSYSVVIRKDGQDDEQILVKNIRGVYADNQEIVRKEIMTADIIATSVGKNALPHIIPTLADGIINRFRDRTSPINIILAENIQHGKEFVSSSFNKALGYQRALLNNVGIVETSISKMVPLVPDKVKKKDPLLVYAESYNTLIIDKTSFLGSLPEIPQVHGVDHIEAYVARKLFIHNLGHAAIAYLGYAKYPKVTYIYEILADQELTHLVKNAMNQSASALIKAYPDIFYIDDINTHIDDLLERFANRALGDTLYRVGRDLRRKLHSSDRVLGAIRLCYEHDLPCDILLRVLQTGLRFTLAATHPNALPSDISFLQEAAEKSIGEILEDLCGLDDAPLCRFITNSINA